MNSKSQPKKPWILRDVRALPLEAYRLPEEAANRQWKHICRQRKMILQEFASYANPDGSSIKVTAGTIGRGWGHLRQTIQAHISALETLGFVKQHGVVMFKGQTVMLRSINVAAVRAALGGVSSSRADGVSSSQGEVSVLRGEGVSSSSEEPTKNGHNLPLTSLVPPTHTYVGAERAEGVCRHVDDQDGRDLFTWLGKIWLRQKWSRDLSPGWTQKTRATVRAAAEQFGVKTVAHAYQLFRDSENAYNSDTRKPLSIIFVDNLEMWIAKTNDAKVEREPFETAAEKRAREQGLTVAEAERHIDKERAEADFAAAAAESDRIRAGRKPRVVEEEPWDDISDIIG